MNNGLTLSRLILTFRTGLWERRDLCFLFLAAGVLRVVLLTTAANQIGVENLLAVVPDGVNYLNMAEDLVNGTNFARKYFLSFGPGYATYFAINLTLFGHSPLLISSLQIILSSLSCLLLYRLAHMLTRSYPVAFLTALLAACSDTAISLSCLTLSDTLYFFLFLASLVLYLSGFEFGRWSCFVVAGIVMGMAALTRSIGQFWPLAMILIALYMLFPHKSDPGLLSSPTKRSFAIKATICIAITLAITGAWVTRNYFEHGLATLTTASAGGAGNIAAMALAETEGKPYREIYVGWRLSYMQEHGLTNLSQEECYHLDRRMAWATFKERPWGMIRAYFRSSWENLNEVNQINRILLPKYKDTVIAMEYFQKDNNLHYASFILSMIGLIILIIRRADRAALVLGLVYVYYAALIGGTCWQGSRLFFPGHIAAHILTAVTLVGAAQWAAKGAKRIRTIVSP